MPRDLQKSDNNKATFADGVSGGEVSLYYRNPTNAERIAFREAGFERNGKKFIDRSSEAELAFGAKILKGIKDGDFVNGEKAVSSNPDSKDYDPDWKKLVLETAGDLVQMLATVAFNGVLLKLDEPEEEEELKEVLDLSEIPGLEDDGQAQADSSQEAGQGEVSDPLT